MTECGVISESNNKWKIKLFTKENSQTTQASGMAGASKSGQMVLATRVIGATIKPMEEVD